MGNDNSSPERSPNKRSISPTNRKISPIKHQKHAQIPNHIKNQNIKNKSKLIKTLNTPKNIMQFIAHCENAVLLKNMNDSNSIGLNHLNILFNPDIINPCLESQLKYVQIIEDSIDKKILGKLKVQNKEFSQKQLESLTNNLIEINNDNSFNNNNNFNLGNLSSIHKKKISREESPASQKDDDFDLTSFSTTIGGKASNNISNTKSYGNNKTTNNSKQIRTFKIRTRDGFSQGDIENNNNYNANIKSEHSSRKNSNSNNNSYRNNLLRKDSPYSIHSNNSSNNNSNSNALSSINPNNNNIQSKNSSNNSFKEQNDSNKNNNNISNKIINKKNHKSCLSDINGLQTVNIMKTNQINNNKNISRKIIRKKLIDPEQILGPKDNKKSPRKNMTNISNIDNSTINNFSNIQENLCYLDNDNSYINKTISEIAPKKPNYILNKTNFLTERTQRSKSPDLVLNNKEEIESENSRIIFNNVRPKARHNYSNSNNNSSLMNNLTNLSSLTSRKANNTNILNDDKFIQNYIGQNDSSYLKTEVNKENHSYMKGVIKKKKIVQNKNINPFKNESNDNKKNKIEVKCIKNVKKINNNINKVINKVNNTNQVMNNKIIIKKEIKTINNINKNKVLNEKPKINENKKIRKKININFNTEKITYKSNLEKNTKNNLNKNKVDTKLILNPKKIEPNKNNNNKNNKSIVKNNFNQNNIKTNNNIIKNKVLNEKQKIDENKKIRKKININFNTEKIPYKANLEKNSKNNLNKNKVDTKLILNPKKIEPNKNNNKNIVKNNLNQNNIKTNNSFKKNKEQAKKNITLFDDNLENINFLDDDEPEPQNTTMKKNENNNNEKKIKIENKFNEPKTKKDLKNNNFDINTINDNKKINNHIINNEIQSNVEIGQKQPRKRKIKKMKNFKDIVFNIDLTNDNDFSKSEDISDNSVSNEENIKINNLNEKFQGPLQEKTNLMGEKNIKTKKFEFNKIDNNASNFQKEKNFTENKFNKIHKKPKIRKEMNLPNSKINRLIIEKSENNSENIDDMDDVCNFSGINNISYTNKQEAEYKNDLFDDNLDDDFQRAHSPKPIFHKKIKFDSKYKNIEKANQKNNFNKHDKMSDLNHLQNQIDDINIIDDLNIIDDGYNNNIDNRQIKNDIHEKNYLKENDQKNINNKNSINSNKVSNNIYNSSQGYFSFKIKKNNNKEKEPIIEEKNESDKNKLKKINESIADSIASSKFNFKINDDIHESEFNDVEFLD